MTFGHAVTEFATQRPKTIALGLAVLSVALIALAALPSLAPERFPFLHPVKVDTDPENMLSEDEAVRVFHDEMKELLALHDIIVVGVVNEAHPEGVFNVASLRRVYELTEFAKTLRGEAIGEPDPRAGVVEVDLIAPSTVDNIQPEGLGVVRFEWLMPQPPETEAEALAVRDKAARLPFLQGTLVAEDGKALALYLPITAKDLSYRVYSKLRAKIAEFDGDDRFYITGLPVAEDTFGVEMFIQMAVSAPLAMLVIFLLMLLFFRRLVLIISPMIVAMASVIITMGLLIVTGHTIHIMSSMIPIFIMPIAVLDSVHILSEFFDRYQQTRDRKQTILAVMKSLFTPMLFTSLTSTAGFASLALTPIPPVQVFGIFVAIGIMAAWVLTITFIPAYVMLLPERVFKNFGLAHEDGEGTHNGLSGRFLRGMRWTVSGHAKAVLAFMLVVIAVAAYGITQIEINDNPTKWFHKGHPIRVADRVLNEHFGGTYMTYLAFSGPEGVESAADYAREAGPRLDARTKELEAKEPGVAQIYPAFRKEFEDLARTAADKPDFLERLGAFAGEQAAAAEGDAAYAWEELANLVDEERQRDEFFKQPESLNYLAGLQQHLLTTRIVGKSNSLADIVKTVHRELFEGAPEHFTIPESSHGVAQCLITYEGSHRPHDLYHFVTPDYRKTSLWLQLKSGDNKDMSRVVDAVTAYIAQNPPPFGLEHDWFGLTYINVIWQEKMVSGMLQAFMGSFFVVLLMMVYLFRSGLWGLISMIPLTVTIGLIYGIIGLIGKDYDMPVAILSSLTLGLAVDFAIHLLARSRVLHMDSGTWAGARDKIFGEPARAILRNIAVIAIGFLPLLAAPLTPYNTVGVFLATILLVSGVATLLFLPSLMNFIEDLLWPRSARALKWDTQITRFTTAAAVAGMLVLNIEQLTPLTWRGAMMSALAGFVVTLALSFVFIHPRKLEEAPEVEEAA